MSDPTGPVPLGDLIREDKLPWVYCRDCCHERDVDPATVPLPAETAVADVGKHEVLGVRLEEGDHHARAVSWWRDRHASAADVGCPIGAPVKKPNGARNVC
jgi:hypothetical protein